jgi:hypothetical protein
LPVEQKAQSSAQPACDEMHSVPRSSSGNVDQFDGVARAHVEQPLARAVAPRRRDDRRAANLASFRQPVRTRGTGSVIASAPSTER